MLSPDTSCHRRCNSTEASVKLDIKCIRKSGYLVKSPSRDLIRNRMARWHLRWFVLYDNKPCMNEKITKREVEIIYYKNHEEQQKYSEPLGKLYFWWRFYWREKVYVLRQKVAF